MSLIKCTECQKEISDQANTCPHCGRAVKPVLIEQNSKRWKKVKLVSWIVFLVSLFMFISFVQKDGFQNPFVIVIEAVYQREPSRDKLSHTRFMAARP